MGREAWHAAVHGVSKIQTHLSNWTDWEAAMQKEGMIGAVCIFDLDGSNGRFFQDVALWHVDYFEL